MRYRPRWKPRGLAATWHAAGSESGGSARVRDISESGIALVVEPGHAPAPGR
ncbi:MAG: hypothetical protein IPJ41_05750 [Phycisphaerales bacterium]|nr:hypothetical protein [Phycisphaerales bacterium]